MDNIEYGFTPKYMTRNGQPWFPVMGEFHFSRYPRKYWRESIYKMKAGGVETVSTYVFWIHHNEIEQEYDFTDQRDLRTFVETVKECGMTMFLRIGPWCHGEVRNGGFPDWIFHKGIEVRANDEEYLKEVRRFYRKIEEQVQGLLYQDGGPIIGIQIENECGHCGGPWGEEGEEYMRRLAAMAKETGLEAPYYTATGWGGAVTGGLLPVMGGYCEAPWDERLTELEPNGNYIFTYERNDHNIGSDYKFGTGITYDLDKFPFLTAELGSGLQVTGHRRPVARPKDIGAMSMVKLGCGANMLGYYMYHGGTNPRGKLSTLQESRETGYPNDLPVYSYDFAAPIREFGQISGTLREIKLLSMFIKDFGAELCLMETYLPKSNPLFQTNHTGLRTSVRRIGNSGYLFVNNYQRRYRMAEHLKEVLEVDADKEIITYPPRDIRNEDFFFLPFHMKVGDGELKTALASPLCILHDSLSDTYIFYSDVKPEYNWITGPVRTRVITLTREEALDAWKICIDREYLIITKGDVLETEHGFEIISRHKDTVKSYPKLPREPEGYRYSGMEGEFSVYECIIKTTACTVDYALIESGPEYKRYELKITYPKDINDCFLQINYDGDIAKLYVGAEWVDDWFYTGQTWEIGLKRFGFPEKVQIKLSALKEDAKIFLEERPVFKNGMACEIFLVAAEAERVYHFN